MSNVEFGEVTVSSFEANNKTFAHTVGDYDNRILIVSVGQENDQSVTGVTYGGVALTALAGLSQGAMAGLWVGFLVAPPVGTANVIVTLSASRSSYAAARTYYNVRPTNPITGAVVDQGIDPAYSVNVVSADSESLVIDAFCGHSDAGVAPGANQTERYDGNSPGIGGSRIRASGSDEPGDGGTITMSGESFEDDDFVVWAGSLNARKVSNNQVIWTP